MLAAAPAAAMDFQVGDLAIGLRGQVALGTTMRMQDRDQDLVGKLNIEGQQQFCEDKAPTPGGTAPGRDCTSVDGNNAYLALPGYPGVNGDNGNLNYDKRDVVNAAIKVAPRLQLTYGDFGVDVSALYFYDQANMGFEEYHPNNDDPNGGNNGFQPRHTPRPQAVEEEVGQAFHLLNAYVSGEVPLFAERSLSFKLGNQVLSLGTTTLLVFNGLNNVNPPDANIRFLPGSDPRDVFQRVPLAVATTNVTENLSLLGFYQFGWKPVKVPPIGTYYSTNDILGSGNAYAALQNGKYREDPDNRIGVEERTQANANLISDAGRTVYVRQRREPHDGGEYGLNVGYFAEWLNSTSFNLTYLNLHSRLPTIGFIAAQEGCGHDSTNQAELIADCNGFKAPPAHAGDEPFPLDTIGLYLDYPENIHAFGGSFSTNVGDLALTGEVVYRPNQPLQIDPIDLGFAAVQPIFPAETINYGAVAIPGRRVFAPDYVETQYRHNPEVQPGQDIVPYERLKTLAYNSSLLLLQGASDNVVGADQVTTLLEVGAFHVLNMPDLEQLQFAAPGTTFHHSAGVDGTGTPNEDQAATTPQNRNNGTFQAGGFATRFSWGYRLLRQFTYESVFPDIRLQPHLGFFHDVGGKSPLPTGEFVAGRKQALLGMTMTYRTDWTATVRYNWWFGGGIANQLADRDNLQLVCSYDF
jgi:hypothetical protein